MKISIAVAVAVLLAAALARAGWDGGDAPVIIQSFEAPALEALNGLVDVKLIHLTLSKTYFDEDAPYESFIDLVSMPYLPTTPSRRLESESRADS